MSQENMGVKTAFAGEDLAPYRRVKFNGSMNYVMANAGEECVGITTDGVLSGQPMAAALRTSGRTFKMVAAGAISAGANIYGAIDGKVQAGAAGAVQGIALEAASADGDVIECVFNIGAALNLDGNAAAIVADGGNGAIPLLFAKQDITDANAADVVIVTLSYKVRIINWWLISRDTTAANVKLKNGTTDATAVKAKGTTNDAIVAGGDIIKAQRDVTAGTAIKVNASAVAGFDVFVMVIKVS